MSPTDLFKQHILRHISRHRSRLRDVFQVVDEGDMPDIGRPDVQGYLEKLKAYLNENNQAVLPDFLLLYCLTVPGSYRGIRPRIDLLGPNRGGFSKRRLEESSGVAERLELLLAWAALIPEFDSFNLLQSLKSLYDLTASAPARDVTWIREHSELSDNDAQLVGEMALDLLDRSREAYEDLVSDVLTGLTDFRDHGISQLTEALATRQFFRSPSAFRQGTEAAANFLCKFLDIRNGAAMTDVVFALAWFRTSSVMRDFKHWITVKPGWVSLLRWDISKIPLFAGWEVGQTGEIIELIHATCYPLLTLPESESTEVSCRAETDKPCEACGKSLSWLFDFGSVAESFWVKTYGNAPQRILFCDRCSLFAPFYSTYDQEGGASFLHAESAHLEPLEERPAQQRFINYSPLPTFALTKAFVIDDSTSVGGIPSWLQNPDYPKCIKCGESMRFIAQFDCGSLPHEEGMFYAFYCEGCRVTAVNFQQT